MKIAICDDDIQDLLRISSFLEKYQNSRKIELIYKVFKNGTELLDTLKGGEFDILILDVFMPYFTGIEVAKEIRTFDNNVKIVFFTFSPEFAVESYSVDAYHYLLKPATEEKLFPILDKLVADAKKPPKSLNIKTQSGIYPISFSNLEYVDVFSKTVSFYLTDGSVREVYGSLNDFEDTLLARDEFVKIHRSYIVNMKWILEFGTKEIITECKRKIPISRALYAFVRETYMKYLFAEKDIK